MGGLPGGVGPTTAPSERSVRTPTPPQGLFDLANLLGRVWSISEIERVRVEAASAPGPMELPDPRAPGTDDVSANALLVEGGPLGCREPAEAATPRPPGLVPPIRIRA